MSSQGRVCGFAAGMDPGGAGERVSSYAARVYQRFSLGAPVLF